MTTISILREISSKTFVLRSLALSKNHAYYGNEFKSFIIYLKNHHMLPFGRIKELIKGVFGHTVSEGRIQNCEKEFSKKLLPIEDTIKQEIMNGNVACFDETDTRSEKKNFQVHVAYIQDTEASHISIDSLCI